MLTSVIQNYSFHSVKSDSPEAQKMRVKIFWFLEGF